MRSALQRAAGGCEAAGERTAGQFPGTLSLEGQRSALRAGNGAAGFSVTGSREFLPFEEKNQGGTAKRICSSLRWQVLSILCGSMVPR